MIFIQNNKNRNIDNIEDSCKRHFKLGKALMSLDEEITDTILEKRNKIQNEELTQNQFFKDMEKELYPYEKCEELLDIISCNYKEKAQKCFKIFNDTLSNIVKNEKEEKFRRLKTNNKVVEEFIINISESYEFLKLIGFEEKVSFNEEIKIEENLLICKNAKIEFFNFLIQNSIAKRLEKK